MRGMWLGTPKSIDQRTALNVTKIMFNGKREQ
jgi:hypothetical protein